MGTISTCCTTCWTTCCTGTTCAPARQTEVSQKLERGGGGDRGDDGGRGCGGGGGGMRCVRACVREAEAEGRIFAQTMRAARRTGLLEIDALQLLHRDGLHLDLRARARADAAAPVSGAGRRNSTPLASDRLRIYLVRGPVGRGICGDVWTMMSAIKVWCVMKYVTCVYSW